MDEISIVITFTLTVVFLLFVTVTWWFKEYRSDDYIHSHDDVFNSFYELSKDRW